MSSAEKVELKVIGIVMASMGMVDIYSNDLNIEAGLVEGGSSVSQPLENTEDYTAVITYRIAPKRRTRGADAHITDYHNLKVFSDIAVRSMYARGQDIMSA